MPSFDVVRVEPDGDSVIAGRARARAPRSSFCATTRSMPARVADASGLFAIVPPPLPPGSHQIVLQSIAPDGTRQRSRESVTVVISDDRAGPSWRWRRPTSRRSCCRTRCRRRPEASRREAAKPSRRRPGRRQRTSGCRTAGRAAPTRRRPSQPAAPTPRPEIKILSVDAEEGPLFVSGLAASGATVRLYLNESFIAPGGAGRRRQGLLRHRPRREARRLPDPPGRCRSGVRAGQVPRRGRLQRARPGGLRAALARRSRRRPGHSRPRTSSASATTTRPTRSAVRARWPVRRIHGRRPGHQHGHRLPGRQPLANQPRIYGTGVRYTVIYGANQTQIRNPDLIYPGPGLRPAGDQEAKSNEPGRGI